MRDRTVFALDCRNSPRLWAGGIACGRELNETTAFYGVSVSRDSARHRKNTDGGRHRGCRRTAA